MAVTSAKAQNGYWIHVIEKDGNESKPEEKKDEALDKKDDKKEEEQQPETKKEEQKTVGNPAESKTGISEDELMTLDINSINREWDQIRKLMEA